MKNRKTLLLTISALLSFFIHAEKITFSATKMSGVAGSKNSSTVLKGNAKVNTKSMIINADYIELSGKDFRMIKAEGNITGKNTDSNLDFTCGRLLYDRETKIATLEDNVNLVDNDNEVTAKAQIIEYNQDTEIAIMQIQINLLQKDNVCTSAYAIYRKKEQTLEMSGNPKIVQKGDTFRAQTIMLDMDSQEITLSGRVKGSVVTENKSDEETDEDNPEEAVENVESPEGENTGNDSAESTEDGEKKDSDEKPAEETNE